MAVFAILENYSSTEELSRRGKSDFAPIKVKLSNERTSSVLEKYLTQKGYKSIKVGKIYGDVYYIDNGFEVSLQLVRDSGNPYTIINVSVFGDKKRGKTRSKLKSVLNELKETLNIYLIRE